MGQSENITVKSNIPKSKFDVFDIRKSNRLNIHNVRKIHLLGFSIQRLWGIFLEISKNFSMRPLFSKLVGAYASGLKPLFHFGLKYIFSEA